MPASGSVVLDTNIAIAFMAGDRFIRQRVAETEQVILSTVVVGELLFGAHRSGRLEHNLKRAEELAANSEVVEITIETARNYGVIKTALRRKGTPIPDNDIWIAATAQQHGAAIITRDTHFDAIENLAVIRW
jgi:tRNA(fMet)-specific endonuclease VapC